MVRARQTIPEDVWGRVRHAVEGGMSAPLAADRYGIKVDTIRRRSKRDGWRTASRVAREAGGVAPSKSYFVPQSEGTDEGNNATKSQMQQSRVMDTLLERLASQAGNDPKAYQSTLSEIAEAMLAAGLADMEPPRTVSEAARLNELIRRNHGFDAKAGAPAGFVRPLRTLTRQPTIDVDPAEPDSVDDFPI